jgi:carbamoyl-phosphate synthase (ammonia)
LKLRPRPWLTKIQLDMNLANFDTTAIVPKGYVGVKAPMFSFTRLRGSDPVLGVEMASTGEVACFGANKEEAFLKSLLSTGFKMPKKNILVSVQEDLCKAILLTVLGSYTNWATRFYATRNTAEQLNKNRVPCKVVAYPTEEETDDAPSALEMIKNEQVGLVINIPTHESKRLEDNYHMRRTAVDFAVPLLTNMQLVQDFADAMYKYKKEGMVGLEPATLFEHYQKESDSDAWTSPDEFH